MPEMGWRRAKTEANRGPQAVVKVGALSVTVESLANRAQYLVVIKTSSHAGDRRPFRIRNCRMKHQNGALQYIDIIVIKYLRTIDCKLFTHIYLQIANWKTCLFYGLFAIQLPI